MKLVHQQCGSFSKAQIPFSLDLLDCHVSDPKRYPFLLESHHVDDSVDGFDILFAFPGESIEIDHVGDTRFFSDLDKAVKGLSVHQVSDASLPFTGGWFVFLSYELIGSIENKLSCLNADTTLPIASAVRIPAAIIRSTKDGVCWIVCETGQEGLIHEIWSDIQKVTTKKTTAPSVLLHEESPEHFIDGVQKIKSYLREGDTFQVNLSRQWTGEVIDDSSYLDVYRSLREFNPSPFAGLACFGDSVICSSSPERLISRVGDSVQMRPIAGTHPRNKDVTIDQNLAAELLKSAKENAEHIMLIDLIRNDLGRICKTGTVAVDETMVLESYAAVHHIVSNVKGTVKENTTASDIIKAVFPGGTITGCPKVRCMEIIHELEKSPRGAYTGSMGYINRNGDMDLNILIRTFTMQGKRLVLRTGAGIVADSVADNELQETRHKAKALLDALDIQRA
ncbi:MAG: aminodeoxychorismate synthase component I [Cycloclasticus sp.]|nr:aminodeoxychorismate synthase component I [Cycloclasticus sp.]